jgi:hypothetical protein
MSAKYALLLLLLLLLSSLILAVILRSYMGCWCCLPENGNCHRSEHIGLSQYASWRMP